jgi:hypothetical protein
MKRTASSAVKKITASASKYHQVSSHRVHASLPSSRVMLRMCGWMSTVLQLNSVSRQNETVEIRMTVIERLA